MEMFSKNLKNQELKIINYEKKEMIPLTNDENKSYENRKFVIYVKKSLVQIQKIVKSKIIVITLESLEALLIIFVI